MTVAVPDVLFSEVHCGYKAVNADIPSPSGPSVIGGPKRVASIKQQSACRWPCGATVARSTPVPPEQRNRKVIRSNRVRVNFFFCPLLFCCDVYGLVLLFTVFEGLDLIS